MKENKSEQYTFAPEEKEIIQKITIVEASVGEKIQNKRELITTKYYSEFVINTPNKPVTLSNVFITAERDKEGDMSYHFRWIVENEKGKQTIEENLVIDENGKVYTAGGLKEYFGNADIDIDKLMDENDDLKKHRLKGKSEKAELQNLDKSIKKQKEGQKDSNKQTSGEKDEEAQEIEDDLIAQAQDLELTNIRKIKDPHVSERMPEVFGDSDEHAQAYSKKLNKYVMLEKKDSQTGSNKSQWQLNDRVEPAKITWRTIISIDEQGEKMEREVPYALMKTNREDKEIAVLRGQYGETNIETVDVLPCQERIARGVREENEGREGEETKQVREDFETKGTKYPDNIAQQVEKIEEQKEDIGIKEQEITIDDYVPNTDTTWRELKDISGEKTLEKVVERYNKEMAKEGADSQKVVDLIKDDYETAFHTNKNRKR